MNRVVLIGRLTKDPELRQSQGGKSFCSFTLAVDRRKTEGQQEADFIRCKAFGKTAGVIERFTRKGSLIGVEGRIQTGSYENQQGQKVFTTDVVAELITLLEKKQDQPQQNSYGFGYGYGEPY